MDQIWMDACMKMENGWNMGVWIKDGLMDDLWKMEGCWKMDGLIDRLLDGRWMDRWTI